MIVGGYEFPEECPENCPDKHFMDNFDQGVVCVRCPIFNCGGTVKLMAPEQYNERAAEEWFNWFKRNEVF